MNKKLSILNASGVLCSIAGATLIALPDAEHSGNNKYPHAFLGDGLALLSAFLYALYSTLLEKRVQTHSFRQTIVLFAQIGTINVFLFALPLLILFLTKEETLEGLGRSVISFLLLNASISATSDLLWARAVIMTSPLVATIGLSLSSPVALICDILFEKDSFRLEYYIGCVFIVIGFLLVNLAPGTHHSSISVQSRESSQIQLEVE